MFIKIIFWANYPRPSSTRAPFRGVNRAYNQPFVFLINSLWPFNDWGLLEAALDLGNMAAWNGSGTGSFVVGGKKHCLTVSVPFCAEWHFKSGECVWRADVTIKGWLMELVLELEGGKVQDKTWNGREIQSGSAYFEKLFVRQITCSPPFTRRVLDFRIDINHIRIPARHPHPII